MGPYRATGGLARGHVEPERRADAAPDELAGVDLDELTHGAGNEEPAAASDW